MVGIYKIENPKGKIYIGKSIEIERRHAKYKRGDCKQQPYLCNSIKKYGWDNHIVKILEECEIENLDTREIYWIKHYNSVEKGLNLTYGGEGGIKSKETKQKMSKSHKGSKKPWAGLNELSQEHKEKLRKGRINTINYLYQYDLDGKFIKKWKNPSKASITLNINAGYLSVITDNVEKTLGGFRFTSQYYESLPPITKYYKKKKIVLQYTKQEEFIKEWESATLIAQTLNIKIQNITSCCRGERKTCSGFIFKYKN